MYSVLADKLPTHTWKKTYFLYQYVLLLCIVCTWNGLYCYTLHSCACHLCNNVSNNPCNSQCNNLCNKM